MTRRSAPHDVGFVGLGAMGAPMAAAVAQAGHRVTLWNRTSTRAHVLADHAGSAVADDPADAARPIVITVLPDLDHVREVVERDDGLLAGWRRHGIESPILVVMGTVSPVGVADWADKLAEHGVRVVDAPVSGGVLGAEQRRLSVMVGGADEDVATVLGVLASMGATVRHLGPVGAGQLAKACNQIVVAATLSALGEAVSMARAGGLDLDTTLDLLGGGLAGSEVLRQKKQRWIASDYEGGGSATNQLKDLRFCLETAQRLDIYLPITQVTTRLFEEVTGHGDGSLDHSVVLRALDGSYYGDGGS